MMKILDFIGDRKIWGDTDPWILFDGCFDDFGKTGIEIRDIAASRFDIDIECNVESGSNEMIEMIHIAFERARKDFGSLFSSNLTYFLCPMSASSDFVMNNMNGLSGFAAKNAVLLYANPVGDWKNFFLRIALHESNHSVRWSFGDPYTNFRNWVIFEGLAECYLAELQPDQPLSPWVTTAKIEDLVRLGPTVRTFWDGFDPPKGGPHEWFFGSESLGVPKWFGYALGFHLVSNHRKNKLSQSWAEYIKTPSEEFDLFIK